MKRNLFTIMLAFLVVFGMNAQDFGAMKTADLKGDVSTWVKSDGHYSNGVLNASKGVFLSESFATEIPATWTNTPINGGTVAWAWDDGTSNTYGVGCAMIDSDEPGSGVHVAGSLESPETDCTAATVLNLDFDINYQNVTGDSLCVDVWDGSAWGNVITWKEDIGVINAGPVHFTFDIIAYKNDALKVRFNYDDAEGWGWHAQISNVVISEPNPHDLGVSLITPAAAQGGVEITPQVTIHNYGSADEAAYTVVLVDGGTYTSTVNVTTTIASGADAVIDMDAWTPVLGAYTLTATVTVTDDANTANDELVLNGTAALGVWKTSTATIGSPMYLGSGAFNTDDNMLYSIGGNDAGSVISIYDVVNDSWSVGAALPGSMNIGSAAYGAGIVYVHAGDDGTKANTGRFWAYDVTADSWTALTDVPAALGWTTLAYSNGFVYLVGGHDGTDAVASVYVYDVTAGTWATGTDLPAAVFGHALVVQDGVLFVISGIGADFTAAVTKGVIDGTDPAAITWTAVADYPVAVFKHEAAPYGEGRLIVTGGNGGAGGDYWTPVGSTYIYDIAGDTWEQVADKTTPVLGGAEGTFLIDNELRFCVASGLDGSASIDHVDYYAEPISVIPDAIKDISSKGISVYPNPSNGTFTVNVENNFNLEVLDITGKVINTQVLNGTNTVKINNAGIYFLRFSNDEGSVTQKVIVQ